MVSLGSMPSCSAPRAAMRAALRSAPAAARTCLPTAPPAPPLFRWARGRGAPTLAAKPSADDWDQEIEVMLAGKSALQTPAQGFGVSSGGSLVEYDTALEDKLMKELELEEAANAANKAAQKAAPLSPDVAAKVAALSAAAAAKGMEVGEVRRKQPAAKAKKAGGAVGAAGAWGEDEARPVPEVKGPRVWVGGLPKKRNVKKDLLRVFQWADGLLEVYPVEEQTNAKTREPICKGFAFFVFKTNTHAENFIARQDGKGVQFGKVTKSIKCRKVTSTPRPGGEANNVVKRKKAPALGREGAEEGVESVAEAVAAAGAEAVAEDSVAATRAAGDAMSAEA